MHTVTVGKGTHQFVRDALTVSAGDMVTFEFFPLVHFVVRAQYSYPYIPYENIVPGQAGFFSGLFPVSEILSNVRINRPMEPIRGNFVDVIA